MGKKKQQQQVKSVTKKMQSMSISRKPKSSLPNAKKVKSQGKPKKTLSVNGLQKIVAKRIGNRISAGGELLPKTIVDSGSYIVKAKEIEFNGGDKAFRCMVDMRNMLQTTNDVAGTATKHIIYPADRAVSTYIKIIVIRIDNLSATDIGVIATQPRTVNNYDTVNYGKTTKRRALEPYQCTSSYGADRKGWYQRLNNKLSVVDGRKVLKAKQSCYMHIISPEDDRGDLPIRTIQSDPTIIGKVGAYLCPADIILSMLNQIDGKLIEQDSEIARLTVMTTMSCITGWVEKDDLAYAPQLEEAKVAKFLPINTNDALGFEPLELSPDKDQVEGGVFQMPSQIQGDMIFKINKNELIQESWILAREGVLWAVIPFAKGVINYGEGIPTLCVRSSPEMQYQPAVLTDLNRDPGTSLRLPIAISRFEITSQNSDTQGGSIFRFNPNTMHWQMYDAVNNDPGSSGQFPVVRKMKEWVVYDYETTVPITIIHHQDAQKYINAAKHGSSPDDDEYRKNVFLSAEPRDFWEFATAFLNVVMVVVEFLA
jgi:hypothetical protein